MENFTARGTYQYDLYLMSEKQRRDWQRKRILEGECDNYINYHMERRRCQFRAIDAAIEKHGLRANRGRRARTEDEHDVTLDMPPTQRERMMSPSECPTTAQQLPQICNAQQDLGLATETASLQSDSPHMTQLLQTMCDAAVVKYGLKRSF